MYIENKDDKIDGVKARIGWVEFSKTGKSVYYRGKTLSKIRGGGIRENFIDLNSGEEYWISGVKKEGSNAHWAESVNIHIDSNPLEEYE